MCENDYFLAFATKINIEKKKMLYYCDVSEIDVYAIYAARKRRRLCSSI